MHRAPRRTWLSLVMALSAMCCTGCDVAQIFSAIGAVGQAAGAPAVAQVGQTGAGIAQIAQNGAGLASGGSPLQSGLNLGTSIAGVARQGASAGTNFGSSFGSNQGSGSSFAQPSGLNQGRSLAPAVQPQGVQLQAIPGVKGGAPASNADAIGLSGNLAANTSLIGGDGGRSSVLSKRLTR